MSKVSTRRALVVAIAFAAAALGARVARSEEPAKPFEPASALYAAGELCHGGAPLMKQLFGNGWPTTRDYRHLTLDCGSGAFRDGVAAEIGSGLGLPISISAYARMRAEARKTTPEGWVGDRVRVFAKVAGLTLGGPFEPTFLPFRRGEASFARSFVDSDPSTWALSKDRADRQIDLRAVGSAMWAESLCADQELREDKPRVDLFVALCSLDAAVAAMHELRTSMVLDRANLGSMPAVASFAPREQPVYFPHLLVTEGKPPRAVYDLPKDESAKKSRLGDQAALLLGLSQLSLALDPSKPSMTRFYADIAIDGKTTPALFDKNDQLAAAELAYFVLESSRTIHVDLSRQRYASTGTPDEPGNSLCPEDVGLYLLGLEQFLAACDKFKAPPQHLLDGKKRALVLVDELAKILARMQADGLDEGFFEAYAVSGADASHSIARRPLASQGLAVRGFIAAQRVLANQPAQPGRPNFVECAQKALKYLERSRWDPARRAYVDKPGDRAQKVSATDGAAVLGALRDVALATGDVRYLLRYRDYLTSLRSVGFIRSATSRQSELAASADGKEGPPQAAAAGVAPVAADVTFP